MILFLGGLFTGYFIGRFSTAIAGLWTRTEGKIEKELNSTNK